MSILKITNYKTVACLVFVIIVAIFFRFHNLDKWGPIFYDEGQYISEAIFVRDVLSWSSELVVKLPFSPTKAALIDNSVHHFISSGEDAKTGRPVHNILMAFGALIFSSLANWGNYTLAIFGMANIFLTYILALSITKSIKFSLFSALILALLPLHIFYSRLTMAEMDSQFFFLISLILYIKKVKTGKIIYWWLTSIFISLALITNGDRFAFITPILAEIIFYRKKAIKQIIIFGVILTAAFILCELPYHLAFLLTHNYNLTVSNPSYIEQQLWIITRLSSFGTQFNLLSFFSYPYMILNSTGYIFCFLLLMGLIKIFKTKDKTYLILLFSIISTLLFQSIHALQALRAISPLLPLFAIAAAIGFNSLTNLIKKKIKNKMFCQILTGGVLLLTFTELLLNSLPLLNYSSPYQKTIDFINTRQAKTIVTTGDAIFRSLSPNLQTVNYQQSLGSQNILPVTKQNPDFIVTTVQKYTIATKAINLTKKLDPTTLLLERSCSPLHSFTDLNSPILIKFFAYEHNSSLKKTAEFINEFKNLEDANLNIYNYKDCLQKINSS